MSTIRFELGAAHESHPGTGGGKSRAHPRRRGELFREKGFDGIGVADLMKSAGLTHGGFYGQFDSKEDLAAQACARALGASAERWERLTAGGSADAFKAFIASIFHAGTATMRGAAALSSRWGLMPRGASRLSGELSPKACKGASHG
jgi:AcrR family transcriptional regulator